MAEILHNVAPFPQPSPKKNPGGDCFACSLKAAVDFLYPERPVPFDLAWDAWTCESSGGGVILSNTWPTLRTAVYALHAHGYRVEIRRDLVLPSFDVDTWSHAWWDCEPTGDWAYRLEAWLSAGWVALAEMNLAGSGRYTADGLVNHIDHFVILDGQRHFWQAHPAIDGAATLDHETHVVCSARGSYWIRTQDLLRKHGVAGLTLLRRVEHPRRMKQPHSKDTAK